MNTKITMRRRLLASTIICGAVAANFGATAAMAQTAAAPAEVEEIVVTGSLFTRKDLNTPSPVTVMTSQSLERAGIVTATDAIRSVSADGAGSIGTSFNGFSGGGASVSLRNVGVSSTLVLIDGLRSANFPINDDGHNAYVDLNSIPFATIERVEVLKDGASSLYGADAIGGVVNLILKKQFVGVAGSVEGGAASRKDAEHTRGNVTLGFGDYAATGWNAFFSAEYQRDGRVSANSRGFPVNTRDLSSIGGLDQNTADSSLTTATPNAVVARVSQSNLNDPRAGGVGTPLSNQYVSLNLNCPNGTYTVTTGGTQGTGCKYNLETTYQQIAPLQERYGFSGRLSARLSDNIEAYATGSYSHNFVSFKQAPRGIRQNQPFGGAPAQATNNPGIVLPVYICSAGINCATSTDRRLNPNNPFAAAFANDPANGAARIYYLFGDIPAGTDRTNEAIRASAGVNGTIGDGYKWRVDAVGARDNLTIDTFGYANNANLVQAINTGSYNFVNPSLNSAAIREFVAPRVTTPNKSTLLSLDASVVKALMPLKGGDLQIAVGGQARREVLVNNNQNARLDTSGLTTSSAFGRHTVLASYVELDAPVLETVDLTASARYDHYSEGFDHLSPKLGVKWTPIQQVSLRGTYSRGFRAPTFAENGPRSSFAGFSGFTPPAAFQIAHGGLVSAGNTNPYAQNYNAGQGVAGNPDLKPETSRSFTAGIVVQPAPWFSATLDYYNIKKSNLIVTGPELGAARNAYFAQTNVTAACAAVAAIGPGYSCNVTEAPDPLFPNALPRILILNVPFVNANYALSTGLDFAATVNYDVPFVDGLRYNGHLELTYIQKYDLHTATGVQKYAGTLGPNELSSGNGTPRWRGNYQTNWSYGPFNLSATTYWVGRIKSVAADERAGTDCATSNQYATGDTVIGERFCHIKRFIYTDVRGQYDINDQVSLYANVGNIFDNKAPIAPGAYASSPNYLQTYHYAGLVRRTYKVGVSFKY